MKRIIIIFMLMFCVTGCVNIKNSSKEDIINSTLNSKLTITNRNNSGYKYYLPNNLQSKKLNGYNELLKDKYYEYYLYVDLVGYYNKIINIYHADENAYYSKVLSSKNMFGYLNIYKNDQNYLIETVYNYGKIEVKVKEKDINLAISNALTILSSITYNDNIIKKMMSDSNNSFKEELLDIFDKDNEDHDYLKEDNDVYVEEENTEFDSDLIN